MNNTLRWTLLVVFAALFSGCNSASHPGTWPANVIQQKLKSKYEFTELTLTPDGEGKFTGTAKSKEGETLKVTIVQDKAAKRLNYDFKGDRGWFEEGLYELD